MTEEARIVLVVEDEDTLRASMVRGLSKLRAVRVYDAGSVAGARAHLRLHPPDVVVSDLDLPDGSGIDIASELASLGLKVPVIFVSAYTGRFRQAIPSRADIEVYEKPIPLATLRTVVDEKLARSEDEPISAFSVADYIQLAAMGQRSVVIEVRSSVGTGTIVVRRGQLWSATDRRGTGREAFKRLLFLRAATIACRPVSSTDDEERTLQGGAEAILLEVAREVDEAARLEPAAPSAMTSDDGWDSEFEIAASPAADAPSTAEPPRAPPAIVERERAPAPSTARAISIPPLAAAAPARASTPAAVVPPIPAIPSASRRSTVDDPVPAVAEAPARRASDDPPPRVKWASDPEPLAPVAAPAPPAIRAPVDAAPALASRFTEVYDRGLDALLRRDYKAAYQAFSDAEQLDPSDRRVQANLTRLREMGVVS